MSVYGTSTTMYVVEKPNEVNTVEIIDNISGDNVFSTFKRVTLRIRVHNKQEETTQFLLFSDLVEEKRQTGKLVLRDTDPATRPQFMIEYPKKDIDGTYFIIRSHTELVE